MKAAQITAPKQTALTELEVPTPGDDDVLIRVRRAGICGTDIHILHGTYQATYPLTPGHEISGEVAAVGQAVRRFQVGDRVTADPNIACNRCENCQRNEPNQCLNWQGMGVTRPGGFAEYVLAPEGNVYPIGEQSFEVAAFIEPLACVVWGIHVVKPRLGDRALVFGAGPMGCLLMQTLKTAGVTEVVMVDKVERRLEIARRLGASHALHADEADEKTLAGFAPLGFDIVTDATGIPAVVEQSVRYARARGKVWLFGVCPPESKVAISPFDIFRKDLSLYGTYAVNRTFNESIALLESGAVQVEPLLSHTLPLEEFHEGLRLAERDPERMKVQFAIS
ncbi:MAG: zinc-dependent alcohol dehydrogenase family protein [Trueperaceae bacterium]|nr:MAG: zinc-dependent alcohol dehydrogenase family protein [Trueperaceae bacterium]